MENKSFGTSPAALVLSEMLIEDKKNAAKVSMLLNSFSRTLHELTKIDSRIALGIAKNTLEIFDKKSQHFPVEYNSFIRNVIRGRYKNWFLEQNGIQSYNNRGRK